MTYDEWVRKYKSHKSTMSLDEWSRTVFEAGKSIERETCAKVCDQVLNESNNIAASVCAGRIRQRENKGAE
jgi:hypothetical protein